MDKLCRVERVLNFSAIFALIVAFSLSSIAESAGVTFNDTQANVTFNGTLEYSQFGGSVSSGDFNSDGIDDVLVGAPRENNYQGKVYIFFGKQGLSGTITDANANVTFDGTVDDAYFGYSVASGDFNNDSIDDALIGAPYDTSYQGKVYIFFGKQGLSGSITDANANVTFDGTIDSVFGYAVISGDFNNDNIDDAFIGAPAYGHAYIFFGKTTLSGSITDANANVTFNSTDYDSGFGSSVTSGDFNGDSIGDAFIGAPYDNSYQGKAYVFYGRPGGSETILDTNANVTFDGTVNDSSFSFSVSSGDFNGDSIDDALIGSSYGASGDNDAYIFFGKLDWSGTITDSNANVTLDSTPGYANFGSSVTSGDFNGDSIDDAFIGAYEDSSGEGKAYVFYGKTGWSGTINDTAANITLDGTISPSYFGYSVASGDFNNDRIDDALVGAEETFEENGSAYIFYISTSGLDTKKPALSQLDLSDPTPLKAGNVTLILDFSEAMNQTVNPTVKIKNSSEYTITSIGWSNSTRWTGWYNFTIYTGDGNYTINITGAEDLAGNIMNENASSSFLLDTIKPTLNFTSPTGDNASTISANWTEINITIDELNLDKFIFNLDGANASYTNASPEITKFNSTRYLFYRNLTALADNVHTYYGWSNDTAGNWDYTSSYTETSPRYITVEAAKPSVVLILSDPSSVGPGNVTFTLNFSEPMNQSISPVVKIKNASEYTVNELGWLNSTRWQGWYNFTVLDGDGNYTVNITGAEDPAGKMMDPDTTNSFILDTVNRTIPVNFVPPTESNGTLLYKNWTEINLTIDEPNLSTARLNWNGTNFSFYGDSLMLAISFDNNTQVGENSTYAVDLSRYGANGSFKDDNNSNADGDTPPGYAPGKFGFGLQFDGVDDVISFNESNADYSPLLPDESFILVALPDTQYYSRLYPYIFNGQTQWVVFNYTSRNIKAVVHLGDITDTWNAEDEWLNANYSISKLDGIVPYAVVAGNHDNPALLNKYFGYTRFGGYDWYGGHYPVDGDDNSYQFFEGANLSYMILNLEYCPDDEVLAWANETVANYSDRQVIVATHNYLGTTGARTACGDSIWQNFARHHDNIIMVLCGHIYGEGQNISVGLKGNNVYEILSDYQFDANGGNGFLRLYEFLPRIGQISVSTYSTYLDEYKNSSSSQFVLDYEPAEYRFISGTIMFWAYPGDTNTTMQSIVSKDEAGLNQTGDFMIGVADGDKFRFSIRNRTGSLELSSSSFEKNRWHHVAASWGPGGMKLYINGVLEDNNSAAESVMYSLRDLIIGNSHKADYPFNGTLDSLRIYNREMGQEEISAYYQSDFRKLNSSRYVFYSNVTDINSGNYTYFAWANDTEGNDGWTDSGSIRNIILDDVPPYTTAAAVKNDSTVYSLGNWTNSSYVDVTLICSDSATGCDKTLYCEDVNNSCSPDTEYSGPLQISSSGASYLRYRSNDSASNLESVKNLSVRIDAQSPSVESVLPADGSEDGDGIVTFSFNASDNIGFYNCRLFVNGQVRQTSGSVIIGENSFELNDLGQGSYNWSIYCSDYAGNQGFSETKHLSVKVASRPNGGGSGSLTPKLYRFSMDFNDTGIQMDFFLSKELSRPSLKVEAPLMLNVSEPEGFVYKYLNISPSNFGGELVRNSTIKFRVEEDWIRWNNMGSIYLAHYNGTAWLKLKTERLNRTGKYIYFWAYASSFSYFAIIGLANESCTDQKRKCDGENLLECEGGLWTLAENCTYGCNLLSLSCNQNPNYSMPCASGEKKCSGNTLELCIDGKWQAYEHCELGCGSTGKSCNNGYSGESREKDYWERSNYIFVFYLVLVLGLILARLFYISSKDRESKNAFHTDAPRPIS